MPSLRCELLQVVLTFAFRSMITLIVIFICITSAFASEYSLFDYVNTTIRNADHCPPHFYGPDCNIPYCVPGNGILIQRKTDEYYCKCKHEFLKGTHCQIIDCNDGSLSNMAATRSEVIWAATVSILVLLILLFNIVISGRSGSYTLPQLEPETIEAAIQRNQNANSGLSRFGDAVRYLARKNTEEPPKYYAAITSDGPPVYQDPVNSLTHNADSQSGNLPAYDSAITIAQPPKYTV
uniref:EGF-like domain-containing protein n=1 Tax=Panagrellus redivivus TaxID=6233 RepID=A0A7E4VCN5_PANRE